MKRKVENRWVTLKHQLRAIAMVHVPVDDGHFARLAQLLLHHLGGDGNVVEVAEPERLY